MTRVKTSIMFAVLPPACSAHQMIGRAAPASTSTPSKPGELFGFLAKAR
ncbi:hypothetical protein ACFOY2_16630 [Nonomuraea purpurea]|uniref:Lipoprotein n=1 Tax=Nonomuraea purpurea TaxID=1849276 RepID=A0ABV8G7Q5_9ACTN